MTIIEESGQMPGFILPERWCLKIDDENRSIVNNWRRNIVKYEDFDCSYDYICQEGSGVRSFFSLLEITTSQFVQFVLKEPYTTNIPTIKEDMSYLVNIFKRLNIK